MADQYGFEEMAADLERIAERVTDPKTHRKVLKAGAEVIVTAAQTRARQNRRRGTLEQSIRTVYDEPTEVQRIGWGDRGFYGRFWEDGYRPITGNRVRVGGRWRWKNKRPSGRTMQRPHIRPAYAAERENVARRMVATFQNELKE